MLRSATQSINPLVSVYRRASMWMSLSIARTLMEQHRIEMMTATEHQLIGQCVSK